MKDIICFGEMLWDLLPTGKMPGGAPMNVAIHLAYAGLKPAVISRVGHDTLGMELVTFLQNKGVNTCYVQSDQQQPTGVVQVNVENKTEVSYDIVAPVAWDSIQPEKEAMEAVKKARAFVFGTLAARQETSRQTLLQLLEIAPYKVLDVNFRLPFVEQDLTEQLLHQADLVKINHHELAQISSWHGMYSDERESMRFLLQHYNLGTLVVTKGENGAIALHQDAFTEHTGYQVQVEDTIGSGDAFLATFLNIFLEGGTVASALDNACLMGALVATHQGATPKILPKEIAALQGKNK